MPFLPVLVAPTTLSTPTGTSAARGVACSTPTRPHKSSATPAPVTWIKTKYPSSSYVRVGIRWFRVSDHAADGVTVNSYNLETGRSMAIHHTCIDEVTMARPRLTAEQKKAKEASKVTDALLEAVEFCKHGYDPDGEAYAQHALFAYGYVSTYNGVVQYGYKIDTAMNAAPHYGRLLAGLKAATGDGVQITELPSNRISIKGKGFRTAVPCVSDPSLVIRHPPDNPVGMVDSRMREGFEVLKSIVRKTGETVMESQVLIRNGDMLATDRHMLGMYWHGISFPEIAVPAQFVEAVLRVPMPPVSFGFTPGQSITFWYENGSFIRSQLYAEGFPDVSRAIPEHYEGCAPVPAGMFAALEKLLPFVGKDTRAVYFIDNAIMSSDDETHVDCEGVGDIEYGIDIDRLLKLKGRITHMDANAERTRFYGENFRGVLANFRPDVNEQQDDDKGPPDPGYDPQTFAHAEAGAPVYAPPTPVSDGDDGEPVDEAPAAPGGFGPPQGY